jgi:type II secretory pathway predicted ATPase ExeA
VLSALRIVPKNTSEVGLYEALREALIRQHAQGGSTVLIIDEAQNLSIEILEELRLLSNINSEKEMLLQVLLVGQPQLHTKLSRPELKQFAQRVSVFFELKQLARDETHAYFQHRLSVAGGSPKLFRPEALDLIHAHSQGVPRLMNQLGDFSLVFAFADRRKDVDAELVSQVVRDCGSGVALPTLKTPDPEVPKSMTSSSAA